jgi:hypothetical protein
VCVSRVFGGKDRHNKVRTIKGLCDWHMRLSVLMAIQLYDLRDRLGLSQPSKVVDWLINTMQHKIDKPPPLQFLPQHTQDLIIHMQPTSMHDDMCRKVHQMCTTPHRKGVAYFFPICSYN